MNDAPAGTTVLLGWQAAGRRAVVVGGGAVATRRATALVAATADVLVVAPTVTDDLRALAADGRLRLDLRPVTTADEAADVVAGADLVVAATDDPRTNDLVGTAARAAGALVNRADDAAAGDVVWAPSVERGPVKVGVTSGAAAPGVAQWVAGLLDDGLDALTGLDAAGLATLVGIVGEVRRSLREDGRRPAPVDWRSERATTILDLIRSGRSAEAKERLQAWQSS